MRIRIVDEAGRMVAEMSEADADRCFLRIRARDPTLAAKWASYVSAAVERAHAR